jgi:hypothetical protein
MPYSNRAAATAPHSNNAALRNPSESPYQQRTSQKDNPTQQLVKQAVDHLIEQREAGKSEILTAYLAAMARFHSYSFANILSIVRARPDATSVAGIRTWNELGRFVKRGEKGIPILAPVVGYRRRRDEADQSGSADGSAKQQPALIGFRVVHVFDVEQTTGQDLPEFGHSISGEVGARRDRLIDFLAQQNIALEYNEKIAPALGVSYGGKIAIQPGQSPAEDLVCRVHETAHELLHKSDRRTMTTATVHETEAEAVASSWARPSARPLFSAGSRGRYTSPIPPASSGVMISYESSREPATNSISGLDYTPSRDASRSARSPSPLLPNGCQGVLPRAIRARRCGLHRG